MEYDETADYYWPDVNEPEYEDDNVNIDSTGAVVPVELTEGPWGFERGLLSEEGDKVRDSS